MFKNRFLLVLGVVSLLLISMAISSFRSTAAPVNKEAASDFYQRHPDWTGSSSAPVAVYPDYFQRHPELVAASVSGAGASDYFERHPELVKPVIVERDDYFQRHPELIVKAGTAADLSDYYFRHIDD